MAQNITLLGAQYSDVPAVTLPKTGGGSALFADPSVVTATASDVAQGKYFIDSSGTLTEGTSSGGGTAAISVVDTTDTAGGTIRTITALDISDTTAVASDVAQGKYFYTAQGQKTAGMASGGGGSEDLAKLIDRSITSITLPSGLTTIGTYVFEGCSDLTTVIFPTPNTVTRIDGYAFQNCSSLNISSLPDNITTMGIYAFYGCTSLALTKLPDSLTGSIIQYTFYNCYPLSISTIPSAVTTIGGGAFKSCEGITNISTNAALTEIAANAFNGASSHPMNIVTASFPNMTASTISTAFGSTTAANACQKLESIDIGSTASISASAFANCYKLQTLVLRRSTQICSLQNISAFLNTPLRGYNSLTGTVYVPNDLISTYQTANNWSTLYNNGTISFVKIEGSQYEL